MRRLIEFVAFQDFPEGSSGPSCTNNSGKEQPPQAIEDQIFIKFNLGWPQLTFANTCAGGLCGFRLEPIVACVANGFDVVRYGTRDYLVRGLK